MAVDRHLNYAQFAATTSGADAGDVAQLLRTCVVSLHRFPVEIMADTTTTQIICFFFTTMFNFTKTCRISISPYMLAQTKA